MFETLYNNILEFAIELIFIIFTPLIITEFILPYILHPTRYGGIPFIAPSPLKYCMYYIIVSSLLTMSVSILSNIMSSEKKCYKFDLLVALNSSKIAVFMILLGHFILFLVPIIKLPLLVLMAFIPYSNLLVTGIMLIPFSLIGQYLTKDRYLALVCS